MQKIKVSLSIVLIMIVLAITSFVFYLELFVIPSLLGVRIGQVAVVTHILSVVFLIIASNRLGAWLEKRNIYTVQKELISNHLNSVISAITNLVTGRWQADADIQKNVFTTGARLGFNVRDEVEIDRSRILDAVERMPMPQTRRVTGQPTDVVKDMDSYLSNLDARKQRLSE